jgi:hypothetical protein
MRDSVRFSSYLIRSHCHDAMLHPGSGTVWVSAVWGVVRVDIADQAAPSPSTAPAALRGQLLH